MAETAQEPRSVLIVENEFLVAEFMKQVLEDEDIPVVGVAATPEEAFDLAGSSRPALALLDIRLSGGSDGIELGRALRQQHGLRAVFLSGAADPGTMARLEEIGAFGFLQKPFGPDQLVEIVRRALET
ncbi:MAG TPA: response regulator [Alphaproteobacteria bacterium]|nr:response regulator [Alphaproteobacteria bacterium]